MATIPSTIVAKKFTKELVPFERYNWLYHLHFVQNDYDGCIEQMNRLQVESEYCIFLKGLIKLRQGDAKSALQQFNLLKSINNTTYIKSIARCLLILGKHQNVCDIIKEAGLKIAQHDWELWTLYGYALLYMGSTLQAKEAFQNALQNTCQVEPFIALAKCQIAEKDYKSAIFVLRRATEISPNDLHLATKLGILLYTTGIVSKGIEKIYEADGQTNTPDLALTIAMGTILQEIKQDIDGAFQRYRQSNVFECPILWNNLGICFASKSKYVAAITCLKRAFFLHPLDWRINYNLGLINLKLKQYASSFQFFKNTVAFCTVPNPNLLTLLAICLEFLNDIPNSMQAHQAACKSIETTGAISLINYAVFLSTNDYESNREKIIEIMMEFEKCWLKRKNNSSEFDDNIMKTATALATQLNISTHLSWLKPKELPPPSSSSSSLQN
ncbi:Bardet-Biedl syndrome 4 [Dermatophagoides pteronyssinus]|uniref:Bardet-Biedl syndrome 4 n=1 Tax=Dermatophagoides pteronyssinus TaxID=6956 RepID=UPI003F676920